MADEATTRIRNTTVETCGKHTLERHTTTTKDGIRLSLLRIRRAPEESQKPVVLVHGCYTNRRFWLTESGKGFAAYLAEQGFDVWIPETRGHGYSANQNHQEKLTADNVIRQDIPALSAYIHVCNARPQAWIGHSYGGLYLLGALGTNKALRAHVGEVIVIGTQYAAGQTWLKFPMVSAGLKGITGLLGRFPARFLGMGPEDEPAGIMKQILTWKAKGEWRSEGGQNYTSTLKYITCPVLAVSCTGDKIDPWEGCKQLLLKIGSKDKQFWCMSVSNGWKSDYGHAEMVVSKPAQEEVWPKLAEWIRPDVAEETNKTAGHL